MAQNCTQPQSHADMWGTIVEGVEGCCREVYGEHPAVDIMRPEKNAAVSHQSSPLSPKGPHQPLTPGSSKMMSGGLGNNIAEGRQSRKIEPDGYEGGGRTHEGRR